MTAHDHAVRVPGCFRCEMTPDETGVSSEDRGVQVEARTLSGAHIGQVVVFDGAGGLRESGRLMYVEHDDEATTVDLMLDGDRCGLTFEPTDLVTLTDAGEDE